MIVFSFRKQLLRIFSIIFAFFVWLYVISSSEIQVEKSIRVNYELPANMAISNNAITEVSFTIKGPRAFVRNLLDRTKILNVNLKDRFVAGKNSYTFPVRSLGMTFPFGVEVIKVVPEKLVIELDRNHQKMVPIRLNTLGEIPSDHQLLNSSISPKEILISGPEKQLRNVQYIETMPVELSGLKGQGQFKLSFINKDMRVKFPFNQVTYEYNIRPTRANLLIKDVPVYYYSSKIVTRLSRRKVNLMVLAKNAAQDKISREDIKVIAEVPSDAVGVVEVVLKAQLPDDFQLLEVQPAKIEITLK